MSATNDLPDLPKHLQSLSMQELEKLIELARKQVTFQKEKAVQNVYQEYRRLADQLGMTVEEIVSAGQEQKKTKPVKKAVEIKYANSQNPNETWTGRGKHPRWLATQLAAGNPLTDFLIVKAE